MAGKTAEQKEYESYLAMTNREDRMAYLAKKSPQELAKFKEYSAQYQKAYADADALSSTFSGPRNIDNSGDFAEFDKRQAQQRSYDSAKGAQDALGAEADRAASGNKTNIAGANKGGIGTQWGAGGQGFGTLKAGPAQAPTTFAPEGYDQSNQGVGEQLWGIHGDEYFQPGSAQKFTDANGGAYGKAGFGETRGMEVSNELKKTGAGEQYWNGVQGKYNVGGPGYVKSVDQGFDLSVDPNLGGFYDNAFNHAAGGINKQLAARGQYGSSAGMQQIGMAATDLNAERANREAQYGLDRYNTKLNSAEAASRDEFTWTQGMGDIAFKAGDENRARLGASAATATVAQDQEMARLAQGHTEAASNDSYGLNNRNSGFDAAFGAQQARDNRVQSKYDNLIGFGSVLAAMGGNNIAGTYAGAETSAGAGMGAATDAYTAEQARIERNRLAAQNAVAPATTAAAKTYDYYNPRKPTVPKGGK